MAQTNVQESEITSSVVEQNDVNEVEADRADGDESVHEEFLVRFGFCAVTGDGWNIKRTQTNDNSLLKFRYIEARYHFVISKTKKGWI